MLDEKLVKAIQDQINCEFQSSYLYLSMANWATANHWNGFAAWLNAQVKEELGHAIAMNKLLLERGVVPTFAQIGTVKNTWTDIEEVFKEAYEHEKSISKTIKECSNIAAAANDNVTFKFFVHFEKEQIEEENSAESIYVALQRIGKNQGLIYSLDSRVGQMR